MKIACRFVDQTLGAIIGHICGPMGSYHLLISRHWPRAKLGCFQTRRAWRQPLDLQLISLSVTALSWWARYHADAAIHLNFPETGDCGVDVAHRRLRRADLLLLLARLPENVHIWEADNKELL